MGYKRDGKIEALKQLRFYKWMNLQETWVKKNEQFGSHDEKKSLVYCEFKAIDIGTR